MATRREVAPVWPAPPAELLACLMDDWLTPAELAEHNYRADCRACEPRSSTAPSCCESSIMLSAFLRQLSARRRWLDLHRVPRAERDAVLPPSAPPVWGGS